jgi:diaminohydroxyphosphoribosylaminopyrimidine deaminase/5-amino-6-(5-phosphoribosylamino)uracil reductase
MYSADDHLYMTRALRLAERGLYTTTPNPRVGCVLMKDGKIIGEGWHEKAGEAHAEVLALNQARDLSRGATAYVTLEPCSHQGRTPPCADTLIEHGIKRVVAAMQDPNPKVAGQGLEKLRQAGIQVEFGLMENEARELNIGFVSRMIWHRPWMRTKLAASFDGKTALSNGSSKWITSDDARADGHYWRARSCVLMTGIGTILNDNPQLTVRDVKTPRQPLRVVVDSQLKIPLDAKILQDSGVIIATAVESNQKISALTDQGAQVISMPDPEGKVDLPELVQFLVEQEINEVLIEAGFRLNGALLAQGLIDEMVLYMAPCLMGDRAQGMFELPEMISLEDKRQLEIKDARLVGKDMRIIARFTE